MRKCPKCGAEYADTDFRTLCGYCMSNLAAASATAPTEGAPATGPIQVGGPPSAPDSPAPIIPITITLPEVTVPEMTVPEMTVPVMSAPAGGAIAMPAPSQGGAIAAPDIVPSVEAPIAPVEVTPEPVAPGPRPGPYKPPLTPQPNPAIPQPPIIPFPSPEPEREPAVPVPVPAPMPEPDEPVPTATVGRDLRPEEFSSSRTTSGFRMFLGFVSGAICFLLFPHIQESFFIVIVIAVLGWLTYYFIRQAVYSSAIGSVIIAPTRRLRLKEAVPLEATVTVIRDLAVSDVEVTLVGEERVVKGSGRSSTTYRHAFDTRRLRIPSPPSWTGGHEMLLTAILPTSPAAPPSFAGRQNFIEWSATLRVGITGLPDINERVPLTILPACRGTAPPDAHPVYQLPELGPLNARIGLTCPVGADNLPMLEVGRSIPFSLRMKPEGDFQQQRVMVELSYMITGSGNYENLTVAQQPYPIAFWEDDPNHVEEGTLTVPPSAPITYDGTHLHIHWAITVRHEQPWGRDRRQVFEVLVVPACESDT